MKKISKSLVLATFLVLFVSVSAVSAMSDSNVLSIFTDDSSISSDSHSDVLSSSDDDDEAWDDEDEELEDDWDDDEDYDEDWGDDDEDDEDEDWDEDDEDYDEEWDEDGELYDEYDGNMTILSSATSLDDAKGVSSFGGSDSQKIDLTYPTGSPIVVLVFSLLFLIMIPFRNR